ncbi:unnamed protein product [Soboliphyme baturini]|uniref:FKBP12-rapamycin associated protein n=1 Tax=Soboliphyme baturini TaxID=241478 RepID=A0A183J4X1_9BILA|nr:unnamed protein product [Soboliphyme baturini]
MATKPRSACDKLRSVLDIKANDAEEKKGKSSDELRAELQMQATMVGQAMNFNKKQGVSAEPDTYRQDKVALVHHPKSAQ